MPIRYPDGKGKITAVRKMLAPNAKLPFHYHVYPTMGNVINGKVEVKKANGIIATFSKEDIVQSLLIFVIEEVTHQNLIKLKI